MSPRDRILATLNRQPTDRTPVDLWCTGEVLDSLRAHTGEDDELAVYQKLGLDKIVWVFPGYDGHTYFDPNESGDVNLWGVPTRAVKAGAATYHEFGKPPLGECDSPQEIADYSGWPDPALFEYAAAREAAERARAMGFATMGPWISHFEVYCTLRGLENALMDIAAEPEILEAGLDRIHQIQALMLERYLTELGDLVDIVFISDDLGTQDSQLISLASWEQHLRPRTTRWCEIAHAFGKKVLFHTDGAARPFIPSLIGCGIDILNPVQHVCPGMDLRSLKEDFGSRLIFHGGVENQKILPFGSAADVRKETRACIDTLGEGGGYICSSCHNVQAGTPVENILAMISEALDG